MKDIPLHEAAQLYAEGWSLRMIGERYGVGGNTVGRRLRGSGVELRDHRETTERGRARLSAAHSGPKSPEHLEAIKAAWARRPGTRGSARDVLRYIDERLAEIAVPVVARNQCACGCGELTTTKFVKGHNTRIDLPDGMKQCSGECKQVKPVAEFYKNKSTKDGLTAECKVCVKARQAAKYIPTPRKKMPDAERKVKQAEAFKQYYDKNAKALREAQRKRRAKHPEAARQRDRENYEKDIDASRERGRNNALRRRLGRNRTTYAYWVEIVWHDPCAYCDQPATQPDHIEPVADGGSNRWSNITGACRRCNSSKSDTPLLLFLARR